jgi:hypothetical protein
LRRRLALARRLILTILPRSIVNSNTIFARPPDRPTARPPDRPTARPPDRPTARPPDRPTARSPDRAWDSVDDRRLGEPSAARERFGDGGRAANFLQGADPDGAPVCPDHDVGIEHGQKGVEVAAARRREEGIDDCPPPVDVRVADHRRASNASPSAARELASGRGRPAEDRRDLVEWDRREVVKHERKSLRGAQGFEHREEGHADGIGQDRFALGVDSVLRVADRSLARRFEGLLASRTAGAEHVERGPGNQGREPAPDILDPAGIGSRRAKPGFLHGVVGLGQRAEHSVGHGPEVGPIGLEALREPLAFVHGHKPSSSSDNGMSNEMRSM